MLSGQAALQNIDQSVQVLRNDLIRIDSQIAGLTDQLAQQERRRVKLIRNIAGVRLQALDDSSLLGSLDAADEDAVEILAARTLALTDLSAEITESETAIVRAEAERAQLLQAVNNTNNAMLEIEAQVQSELPKDIEYMAQLETATSADAVAKEASSKAQMAREDMTEKAKPYLADELFMYLWQRGWGTTEYSARALSRTLDGWVARVIDFAPARINFWNLNEIPARLEAHAQAVADRAEEAAIVLQEFERQALVSAGIEEAERQLIEVTTQLDSADDELENLEQRLSGQITQRITFLSGQDEFLQRCIERLTEVLKHADLQAVRDYVRSTPSVSDDAMVLELQEIDDTLIDLAADLREVRSVQQARLQRMQELQDVRRQFKDARFDDVRSGFGNKGLLHQALAQFLAGAVSGVDLWQLLQRNQRRRDTVSQPDFGSGSLGQIGDLLGGGSVSGRSSGHPRRSASPSWHLPSARRGSGGGFKLPRAAGRSRGGFKTGGSF